MYFRLFVTLLISLLQFTYSASAEQRTWTDTQGRSMQAEFVRVDLTSDDVIFRKDMGKAYRFPLSQLSKPDQDYILGLQNSSSSTTTEPDNAKTSFEKAIGTNLVRHSSSRVKRVKVADLNSKDYYAIYYSAHWCPPCRKFTPTLVNFYNDYSKKYDNFEIIFVSSDRSEDDMENYMKSTNMPWLALEFDQKKKQHPATKYSGNGIPCLVLLDNKGSVLADSYVGSKYVGPTSVMNTLKEKLDQQ